MDDQTATHATPPTAIVGELLQVVPRLVDRTRSQAEMARSLVAVLPCVGRLVARPHHEHSAPSDDGPGAPEHEPLDVLGVLADDGPDDAGPVAAAAPTLAVAEPSQDVAPAPSEDELPIQDYDSLAASQVVPRLATLSAEDLETVQRYEQAGRHRQTILHRVAQLLAD